MEGEKICAKTGVMRKIEKSRNYSLFCKKKKARKQKKIENRTKIEHMYRVSFELYKHEWKFGRTRNAVGTRAPGECFHSFFEFSQTFTSVCITR